MLYQYGRNWTVPADGEYHLAVHIQPPTFMRHDEVNGCRFTEPAEVEFSDPTIEERLLLMFALFAERWGRVTPDGVMLTLPLTHANLASLCGARRPSVTMALHSLEREGLLSCEAKGTWLLRRAHLADGRRPSCLADYDYERLLGFGLLDLAPGGARPSPSSP